MKPFYSFLIRSNIYIALSAVFLYYYYSALSSTKFSFEISSIIFTFVFLGYNALRLSAWKLKKKYIGHENIRFYHKNLISISAIGSCSFIISLFFIFKLDNIKFSLILMAVILFILYENPYLKFNLRSNYIKPLIIGSVWSLFITALSENIKLLYSLDCFLFISILSLAFDLRSKEIDHSEGLKTIAHLKCVPPAMALSSLYIFYCLSLFYLSFEIFFILSIPLFIFLIRNKKISDINFALGIDGLIIMRSFFYIFQY